MSRLIDGRQTTLKNHHIEANIMKKRSSRAIIVLEAPWGLDDTDANRTSVLPFVEGIAKYSGDTEVIYANFYDESSFNKALVHLTKCRYKNAVVYLAAHGENDQIGDVDLLNALGAIGKVSKDCNITGVMLGSCFVGGNRSTIEAKIQGSNLHWCVGYASESSWLPGAMIDCSILANMLFLDKRHFESRNSIISNLAHAISSFSDNFFIGKNSEGEPVALVDSLKIVIQPIGQGKRASSVTAEVFEARKQLLKQDAESER